MSDGKVPPELSAIAEELATQDENTRQARAERDREIGVLISGFPPWVTGIEGGGMESSWMLREAFGCYREGYFGAAVLCAHASCERELAGRMAHDKASAPAGWEMWGLGRLLKHAASERWFSASNQELLERMNENRRDFSHFRGFLSTGTVVARTLTQFELHHKDEVPEHMAIVLRQDALESLRAALLVRSE